MARFEDLGLELNVADDKIDANCFGPPAILFKDQVRRVFDTINQMKVIAHKNGTLVYNLYNPPQPSAAGMRALERKVMEAVTKAVFPATANLAVTHKCQCKCRHCSADPFIDPSREEVTTAEIKEVIDDALALGANLVVFTGGEPTMHPDLPELIDYVDKDKAMVLIFTNGQFLTQEYVDKLTQAGVGTINISIDHPDPAKHNAYRKVPNLYEKAMEGAKRAQEAGILVGLSTYATHETIEDGSVEKMIEIALENEFKEITIFDCIPSGRFLKDASLILTDEDRAKIIALHEKYHNGDYPVGVVAMCKVNSSEGAGCFGAFSQFYMTAYGDINPCDFNPVSFGNVREVSLPIIWNRMTNHPDFNYHHKTCRMQSPAYRAKYIDPLPEHPKLPVSIEDIERLLAESQVD